MRFEFNKKKYTINDNLANSIIAYINAIFKYNQDLVIVFDGYEGAGKSTLMRQIGAFCVYYMQKAFNHKIPFNINNVLFDLEDYTKHCLDNEKEKGHVHILDESRAIANRKRSTSSGNVSFTNYLSECRSAGHIHLIALPAFHDLDSYISTWRMSFLVNVRKFFNIKEVDGVPVADLVLGTYRVYLNDSKLKAMYYHKMRYIYPKKSTFTGKFANESVLDEQLYEEKKAAKRKEKFELKDDKETKKASDMIVNYYKKFPNATTKEVAEIFKVHLTTSQRAKKKADS